MKILREYVASVLQEADPGAAYSAEMKKIIKSFKEDFEGRKAEYQEAAAAAAADLSDPTVVDFIKRFFSFMSDDDAPDTLPGVDIPELYRLEDVLGDRKTRSAEWSQRFLMDRFMRYFDKVAKQTMTTGEGAFFYRDALEVLNNAPNIVDKIYAALKKLEKKLDKAAEAPAGSPLGRIAFAPKRRGKPYEPNTPEEEILFQNIVDHFHGEMPLDPGSCDHIRRFLSKGMYTSVFKEPKARIVYRGIGIRADSRWLLRVLKAKKLPKDSGSAEVSYRYTPPASGSFSWSTSKSIASQFATKSAADVMSDGPALSVVFHAQVDDNPSTFITGPGGLYNIEGFDEYATEDEAIALGPVKVFKVEWKKIG